MSNTLTPIQKYQEEINSGELQQDAAQALAMEHLEKIYHDLIDRHKQRASNYGKIRRKIKPRPPVNGLYLWGSVGAGKTHLVDIFYDCVPVAKLRVHFHAFMQRIHNELSNIQGTKNPLQKIAKKIADKYLVICFDEFFISNITDAMLLGELLKALFEGGLCFVATSNTEPDELYKNGLQRQRFLPAIQFIKSHTQVLKLESKTDYRLRHLQQAGIYYTPLNDEALHNLEQSFKHFSAGSSVSTEAIQLFNRQIHIVKQANGVIWFDFMDLCDIPRSQKDFLAIAKEYHTVLISNVPILHYSQRNLTTSFINLIDIFYDQKVRVVISAATQVDKIYPMGELSFEFERTQSRLIEMQSAEYFRSHRNSSDN